MPSDQSSCIKESQDSDNGDEQPRQEEHYSSNTGGNGPSFTPPKQRSHYTKKAKSYNDDVDEQFHGRYLHPNGEQVNIAATMSVIEMLRQLTAKA